MKYRPAYHPTAEEIAQRSAEIQASWSRREEISRRAIQPVRVTIPKFVDLCFHDLDPES